MATDLLTAALATAAAGKPVFPCDLATKRPLTEHGLYDASTDPTQIGKWWKQWPGAMIGMPTGKASGVFVLDVDYDPDKGVDGFAALAELEAKHGALPDTPTSITPRQGLHLHFNWREGIANSAGKLGKNLDIRGEGGYVVLPPSVRSDRTSYRWRADCPADPVEAPDWSIALATTPKTKGGNGADHSTEDHKATGTRFEFNSDARDHVHASDAYGRAALEEECAAVASAAEGGRNHQLNSSAFSLAQLVAGGVLGEAEVQAKLMSAALRCGLSEGEAERTINSGFSKGTQKPRGKPEGDHAHHKPHGNGSNDAKANGSNSATSGPNAQDDAKDGTTAATPGAAQEWNSPLGEWNAGADDDSEPSPPRAWLLGNIFCREFASSILGPGAVGKTALRYVQYLSLATGRSLTGDHVFQRSRVLIISLEDGPKELRRRIKAARLHHGIAAADLDGWLFLSAPRSAIGKLVEIDNRGNAAVSKLASVIKEVVVHRKIDLIALDPFIKAAGVEENSNTLIDIAMQVLTDLANEHDLAVDVPHHIRKGGSDPGNADTGRGASAQKDAGRLVYTLSPMSPDEAKAMCVSEQERRSLVRMDSAKVNICPPLTEARWFRLVGVKLDNATELYPHGDEVQTVEPWTPPDLWEGLSKPLLNEILTEIDAGLPDGDRYSNAPNAKDRAAWQVIVKHAPDTEKERARQLINIWVKNGVLVAEKYESETRRAPAIGLRVEATKRPS